jgi:hypothetical protein
VIPIVVDPFAYDVLDDREVKDSSQTVQSIRSYGKLSNISMPVKVLALALVPPDTMGGIEFKPTGDRDHEKSSPKKKRASVQYTCPLLIVPDVTS